MRNSFPAVSCRSRHEPVVLARPSANPCLPKRPLQAALAGGRRQPSARWCCREHLVHQQAASGPNPPRLIASSIHCSGLSSGWQSEETVVAELPTEGTVLQRIVEGRANRGIVDLLHIGVRMPEILTGRPMDRRSIYGRADHTAVDKKAII